MEPKYRILIIEDDPIDQKILRRSLEDSEISIQVETMDEISGTIDQKKVHYFSNFDFIFVDYAFPSGVASNFIHFLKKHWSLKTPLILLTGNDSPTLKGNVEAYSNVFYQLKEKDFYDNLEDYLKKIEDRISP